MLCYVVLRYVLSPCCLVLLWCDIFCCVRFALRYVYSYYVMLRDASFCCVAMRHVTLRYATLSYAVVCFVTLCCVVLCFAALLLCYIVLSSC